MTLREVIDGDKHSQMARYESNDFKTANESREKGPARRPAYPGHDLILDVLHDVVPVLALLRSLEGDHVLQVPGLDRGRHSPVLDGVHVVGDVIHHLFASLPELFGIHGCGWAQENGCYSGEGRAVSAAAGVAGGAGGGHSCLLLGEGEAWLRGEGETA